MAGAVETLSGHDTLGEMRWQDLDGLGRLRAAQNPAGRNDLHTCASFWVILWRILSA
jgi:hypothetical protein